VTSDPDTSEINRRQFLKRSAKAGVSVAAACAAGLWCYDSKGPDGSPQRQTQHGLLDFSIENLDKKMSIARGKNRAATLHLAIESLGGIETFIKKDDRVLLKVNAAFASPPILSATTHPQLVSEMVQLCYKAGAARVVVTDNPINDPTSCFALSGIEAAARGSGAELVYPKDELFKPLTVPNASLIQNWPVLYEPFQEINKVIGMAPVKDHHRSGASMTMKNWYGLLGGRRNIFHQDIQTIITDLATMVRPSLVVLDGTVSMMTNGPTGGSLSDLKETNMMIVSTDQVAADAFGATLLDKTSNQLPFISKAEAAGVGTADYRALNPVEVSL